MKSILFGLLTIALIPFVAHAVPPVPARQVWISPEQVKAGDAVELAAFVYNNTDTSAIVIVAFFDKDIEVARTTKSILPQSALTMSASWVVPEQGALITAKVISAVDANKKMIPEMIGTIGTVSVGNVVAPAGSSSITDTLKRHLGESFAVIEPWRKKQAIFFSNLRDTKKQILGINSTKQALDALNPLPPEVPATPGTSSSGEPGLEDIAPRYQGIPVGDYIVFLYASALATIFSSIILFYIVFAILTLAVLRFLVRIVA